MFYDLPRTAADMPREIPIFPLGGTILLPGCRLPLNIFEPRYLNMVFDALKDDRLIGMIQPQPATSGANEVYRIGGAGRITAFEETDDGRVMLHLTGLSRFVMKQEAEGRHGYRRAVCDWLPFATDLVGMEEEAIVAKDVLAAMAPFFELTHLRAEWHSLERIPGADLVDVLATNLPLPPEDKQALLEAPDIAARFEVLKQIAALHAAENASAPPGTRH